MSTSASASTSRLVPSSIAAASQRKRRRSSATRNGNGTGAAGPSQTSTSRPREREAATAFGTSWEQEEEEDPNGANPFDALISRRLSASSHASSDSDGKGNGKGKGKGKERAVEQDDHNGQEGTMHMDLKEDAVLPSPLPVVGSSAQNDEEEEENIIEEIYDDEEDESLHCAICLGVIDDRTVVQPCSHDAYCFRCILAWTEQSRKCPLCNNAIELLLHHIRSERDFQRHYLAPLIDRPDASSAYASASQRTAAQMLAEGARSQLLNRPTHPRFKFADWKMRNRPAAIPEMDAEDLAIEKRRYVYRHGLFVKHVGANRYTRYRDVSFTQISASSDLKARLTRWLRRELRVFDGIDLEFLVGYGVSIASQLELRSDSATRLMSEFLGERDAEHFLHETSSFLRSPYSDIRNYDRAVQYDRPERKDLQTGDENHSEGHKTRPISETRKRRSLSLSSSDDDRRSRPRDARKYPDRAPSPARRSRRASDNVPRQGRDTYVPEYSRLARRDTKPRRDRRDRYPEPRSSVGHVERRNEDARRQRSPDQTKNGTAGQSTGASGADLHEVPLPEDSDLEDLISLGDVEEHADADLPKIATGDAVQNSGRQHENGGLSIRGRGHAKQRALRSDWTVEAGSAAQPEGALAIRGASRSKDVQREPALLHRLSARSASISPAEGGYRSAKVGNDLRQKLMARLEEEKSRTAPAGQANGNGRVEGAEQAGGHPTNVLPAVPAAIQADAAQSRMADLRARLLAERKSQKDVNSAAVNPVDRMAALKAKLRAEKEMRLAQEGA